MSALLRGFSLRLRDSAWDWIVRNAPHAESQRPQRIAKWS